MFRSPATVHTRIAKMPSMEPIRTVAHLCVWKLISCSEESPSPSPTISRLVNPFKLGLRAIGFERASRKCHPCSSFWGFWKPLVDRIHRRASKKFLHWMILWMSLYGFNPHSSASDYWICGWLCMDLVSSYWTCMYLNHILLPPIKKICEWVCMDLVSGY